MSCYCTGCASIEAAKGPARGGKRLAEKANYLQSKLNYNGAASVAATSARKYLQAAECYAQLGRCNDASSAAASARTAAQTASDAAAAIDGRRGDHGFRICRSLELV